MYTRRFVFFFMLLTSILVAACAPRSERPSHSIPMTSASFNGVTFKTGRPYREDSLAEAVSAPSRDQIDALRADIGVKNVPGGVLRIVGYTDSKECVGVACDELSFRRAKIVYDWLVAAGVRKEQLKLPEGRGDKMQLNDNSTEEKRQINRRTEVGLVI